MNPSNNALTEAVYYILLVLTEPKHGYGIMQQTEAMSHGRLRLSAGTLYGALASLLEKGWIEQVHSLTEERKKEYQITPKGLSQLQEELLRLEELVENGKKLLNP
uniref:PadR family transcriptional regulator n=1 Tax=Alistipes sp. TaxID=1872444 RepID=UPI004057B68E